MSRWPSRVDAMARRLRAIPSGGRAAYRGDSGVQRVAFEPPAASAPSAVQAA
jgi:hypothetical protein